MRIGIIGGGIQGLGVALSLSDAGHQVVVFEAEDKFASKASANSLKIIHGGFRYLQTLNISRLIRSLSAQAMVAKKFPEFVKPLPCLMPLSRSGLKSKYPVMAAALFYSILKFFFGGKNISSPKVISKEEALTRCPFAREIFKDEVLLWYDLQLTSHEKLCESILSDLTKKGVSLLSSKRVLKIETLNDDVGLIKVTTEGGEDYGFDKVVVASGYQSLDGKENESIEAMNIVFNKAIDSECAVGFQSDSGRLFFLVPRGERSALGTEYFKIGKDPKEAGEILLKEAAQVWRQLLDLLPTEFEMEIGTLPARKGKAAEKDSFAWLQKNVLQVVPAKYTTFLSVGEKVKKFIEKK